MADKKEVLIISTDPDWWEYVERKKRAIHRGNTSDASYVAFYRTAPVSAITHIGEVEGTKKVSAREELKDFPKVLKKIMERYGSVDRPSKVFYLKNLK